MSNEDKKSMKVWEKDGNLYVEGIRDFHLGQTLECGQCFHFEKTGDNEYYVSAKGRFLHIAQNEDYSVVFYDTDRETFDKIWFDYFDFGTDYGRIKEKICELDDKLKPAIDTMWGIRILNQDFFETMISFIISQNKQIPHIKQIVARISHDYGKYQGSVGGIDFYGFPTPQQLSQADIDALRECKTGFRAPYIYNAVEFVNNEIIKEENLRKCGVDECREQLMKIKGVGMKVANCVSLFGLGYREAFPVDVWIKRIMQSLYFDGKEHSNAEIESYGVEHFGKYGGYAQQYLFYYGKSEKIGLKNKTN